MAPWPAALLREIMQPAEDRYLEVYAWELEEFTLAGDMRGWYGHLKGGRKLQGKKVGSAQYIRDDDGKLVRKLEEIRARWRRYFTSECFNDWGGRGYDDSVPGDVTKATPSGDRTT